MELCSRNWERRCGHHGPVCDHKRCELTDCPLRAREAVHAQLVGLQENPKHALGVCKAPLSYLSSAVVMEEGLAMLEGGLKYGAFNYRVAPITASVYFDAMMRHLMAWWEGQDFDPDSQVGLHHITKLRSSAGVLRDAMLCGKFIDDRPPRTLPDGWMEILNLQAKALIEAREKTGKAPVPRFTEAGTDRKNPDARREPSTGRDTHQHNPPEGPSFRAVVQTGRLDGRDRT